MPNIPLAKELCKRFIKELAGNRKGFDDAGIARLILTDLATYGRPTASHERRLSFWCHTNGNPFKRGMPLAQQISVAIYDRVITRQD
jgi:hypothetical protein